MLICFYLHQFLQSFFDIFFFIILFLSINPPRLIEKKKKYVKRMFEEIDGGKNKLDLRKFCQV